MLSILLMDVDDTLLDFAGNAMLSLQEAAQDMNLTLPENFLHVFHKGGAPLWRDYEKGRCTMADIRRLRCQRVFDRLGITADGPEFEARFLSHLSEHADPVPGAADFLHFLSGRVRLYAASNASSGIQEKRLAIAGFLPLLDGVFVSEEIGFPKPDPRFFESCLGYAGVSDRHKAGMLGDSLTSDVQGALNTGIHAFYLNRFDRPASLAGVHSAVSLAQMQNIILPFLEDGMNPL